MNHNSNQMSEQELYPIHGIEIDVFMDEENEDEDDSDETTYEQEDHHISLWSLGMSYRDFM